MDKNIPMEEISQANSSNSGTTKMKQHKKVQQRGVGIAQLEKMRIEEQTEAAAGYLQQAVIPKSPPSSTTGVMTYLFLKPSVPVPFTGIRFIHTPLALRAPASEPSVCLLHEAAGKIKNKCHFSPQSLRMIPSPLQKRMWQKQQHPLRAMANKAISSSSSSGQNFPDEPPSNQNSTDNYDLPICWKDPENLVHGTKALNQLNAESSGSASHPCKVSALINSYYKFHESLPSHGRNSVVQSLAQSTVLGGSNSGTSFHKTNSNDMVGNQGKQKGGFVEGSCQKCCIKRQNSKQLMNPTFICWEDSDNIAVQREEILDKSSILGDQQIYNFFPAVDESNESTTQTLELMKDIDLDLKL